MRAAPVRSSCCHRAIRRTHGLTRATSTWNRRSTDRSEDRLTVSRISSQAGNRPNLTVFLHTTEVVDPAPIRLLSSSLPILYSVPGPFLKRHLRTEHPIMALRKSAAKGAGRGRPLAVASGGRLRPRGPVVTLGRSGDEVGEFVPGGTHRDRGTEPVLELFTGAVLDA